MSIKVGLHNNWHNDVEVLLRKPIVKGRILFYGDSAFRRWNLVTPENPYASGLDLVREVTDADGRCVCVNQGFGSATAEELLYFYPRLVKPWEPSALVINVFGNDQFYAYSPLEIVFLLERLIGWARLDNPGIKIYITTPKIIACKYDWDAGPLRAYVLARDEYIRMIEDYAARHDDCRILYHEKCPLFFADQSDVGSYETARRDLYVEDKIHFSQEGYRLYAKFFRHELFGVGYDE